MFELNLYLRDLRRLYDRNDKISGRPALRPSGSSLTRGYKHLINSSENPFHLIHIYFKIYQVGNVILRIGT